MLIVFEGIDGSGKTTVSNRVARELGKAGIPVRHVRAGGKLMSAVAEGIRQFGRDSRNLALAPWTEFLLYLARDAQQLEEAMRPGLAQGEVVIADRYLVTAEVLARFGRQFPEDRVRPVVDACRGAFTPDLIVLVDVDPYLARARRRVARILDPASRPGSRKGLSGAGLMHRMRDGYLAMAQERAERWIVVDNSNTGLKEIVSVLAQAVAAGLKDGPPAAKRLVVEAEAKGTLRRGVGLPPGPRIGLLGARRAFLEWIDLRSQAEPDLAAYFLTGLWGREIDERRLALAARAPEVLIHGTRGMGDPVSWELRRMLMERAPGGVVRSLEGIGRGGENARADGRPKPPPPMHEEDGGEPKSEMAWRIREELLEKAPLEVAASLDGHRGERAWAFRERLYARAPDRVLSTLGGDSSERAWALRERWRAEHGGADALSQPLHAKAACESIGGLGDERAWAWRKEALLASPSAALQSLWGVDDDSSWKWRDRWLERAPRSVLRTISGLDDPRAWALRRAACGFSKEALDSIVGMEQEEAWKLREDCAELWPSTVVKGLGWLLGQERTHAFVLRQVERHPDNLSLLKHVTAMTSSAMRQGIPV
jgi:dTMP kinase